MVLELLRCVTRDGVGYVIIKWPPNSTEAILDLTFWCFCFSDTTCSFASKFVCHVFRASNPDLVFSLLNTIFISKYHFSFKL